MIKLERFAGMVPRVSPRLLGPHQALDARNCRLVSGALEAYQQPLAVGDVTGAASSLYHYDGRSWFEWTQAVDCVRSPVNRDRFKRVYWTGQGEPKMTVATVADSGEPPYPNHAYRLGIPAPTQAPQVALVTPAQLPPAADPAQVESRFYVYTLVSAFGEEGPPSAPSPLIEWNETRDVEISGLQSAVAGAFAIERVRVYRTHEGQYQLVKEVPFGHERVVDEVLSQDLGEPLISMNWRMPPGDLSGLTAFANGLVAGFRGNQVLFCEPFQPHAWPEDYQISVDYDIVGLGAFGNHLVILTNGFPYVISGGHPAAFSTEKIEVAQACVSKASIVSIGHGVLYASADGLVQVSFQGTRLLTQGLFSQREWQQLNPASLIGVWHDQHYLAFFQSEQRQGAFVITPEQPDQVSFVDDVAQAVFLSMSDDALYFTRPDGPTLYRWNQGAESKTYSWHSRPFVSGHPTAYRWGRLEADGYPITLTLLAPGQPPLHKQIHSAQPFRLGVKRPSREWRVVLEGSERIHALVLADSVQALQQ